MRLSSMADYAVVVMAAAARRCGSAALAGGDGRRGDGRRADGARGGRVSAAALAAQTRLPTATVQKLVSKLSAAGLLRSVRGAGGGLTLARPAAAITLAEIVEAVEGPIALTACVEHGRHDCSLEAGCSLRPHWSAVNRAMRDALAAVPLSQLAAPAAAAPSPGMPAAHLPPSDLPPSPAAAAAAPLAAHGHLP